MTYHDVEALSKEEGEEKKEERRERGWVWVGGRQFDLRLR